MLVFSDGSEQELETLETGYQCKRCGTKNFLQKKEIEKKRNEAEKLTFIASHVSYGEYVRHPFSTIFSHFA